MGDELKIGIIVIGYNIENYLENCLESIKRQNYSNFEVVFVDDGSKDNTFLIAEKYVHDDERFKAFKKQNGGIISARKYGLERTNCEYVMFVDGDDWLNENMLNSFAKELLLYSRADIVSSNLLRQEPDGSFIIQKNNCEKSILKNDEYFNAIMSDKAIHHMFPKLYKKEFLIMADYMNYPNITMAEDLLTNSFLGLHNPYVILINQPNYYYRYNIASVSRSGNNGLLKQIETLEYIKKYLEDLNVFDKYKDLYEYQWFSYFYTYIDLPLKYWVKKQIRDACKQNLQGYKNNKICIEFLDNHRNIINWRATLYLKIPQLGFVYDKFFLLLKKTKRIYDRRKREKNLNQRNNHLKEYYKELTEQIRKDYRENSIFLIGTSDRSNVGDHLIAQKEKKFLEKIFPETVIFEITGDHYRQEKTSILDLICSGDMIFITGGGFLGDLWMDEEYLVRSIIKSFPDNKIVILPQTISFLNGGQEIEKTKLIYSGHSKLYVTAREKQSYDYLKSFINIDRCGLFPDMALYEDGVLEDNKNGAVLCFRTDKESCVSDKTKIYIENYMKQKDISIENASTCDEDDILLCDRKEHITKKIEKFAAKEYVITDRLHGMIISVLAGTKCIAFDNSSNKVSGVYNCWLKECKNIRMVCDLNEFELAFNELSKMPNEKYYSSLLTGEYDKLKSFIKE